ncbi:clustered mitochondria protein homolog [Asterias amurensis]|uniref:clustered mitochondria protein homolog n=1 Tax=Asterias amurensis TaxID=7602 RepID=UPI003AB67730
MAEDSVIEKNTSENAEQTQKLPSESELSCQGDGALKTADSAVLKLKAATAQPNLVNGQRGGGDADSPATMNGMNSDHQDNRLNGDLNTTEAQNGHEKPDQVVQPDTKCPLLNGHSEASVDDPDSKSEVVTEQSDATESNSEDLPSVNGTEEGDKSKEVEGENDERTDSEKESQKDSKVEDVIVIQDTAFTLKIVPPVSEAFELQVSPQEMVQEIHQVLMDREDTCHRTCFSLQLDGNVLDNFAELKSIEGLKEGSVVKVVEEPYTVREARIHVRHVRDLLKSLDPSDAYNGMDCQSLSFLTTILNDDRKRTKSNADSVDCTPPDYLMPSSKERPLVNLQPISKESRVASCMKVLTVSGWNPPPGTRKMHGDLMYLYVMTMEGTSHHITASTRGFYINQSTQEMFNPKPAEQKHSSHSLIELLNKVSPIFKKNFAQLLKKRAQRHPFERVPTPFQVYSWMAPQMEHTIDSIRAEDAYTSRLGYEEHIPGQTRDWNEETQTTRELPRKNLPERLLRERAIFKVHSDFVAAATRGAMAVIDGNVMAINPGEDTKMQMFIWNNIFFSLGFDVKDHYKEFGGDAAALVAPSNDLQGVKAYNNVDIEGLYTLGTVVIDYRGYRITAQSIIPGILEREQEESVIYGSIDFGKTVVTSEKYQELLAKSAQQLKILPHKVTNHKGGEIEIFSSIECKGIKGNDGRHYVLDLLRTFPPDINFLPIEGEELNDDVKALDFPRQHRHKLCCLRQELIEAFVEHQYMVFVRYAAVLLMQQQKPETNENNSETTTNIDKSIEEDANKTSETETTKDLDVIISNDTINEAVSEKDDKKDCQEESNKSEETDDNKKSENDLNDNLKEAANAVLSGKCPMLNGLDTTGIEQLAENITNVTDEAAKALAETQKKKLTDSSHKEVIAKASKAAGSLVDTEFDIRFNPDVFSEGVTHVNPESEQFQKEKRVVKDAARFLLVGQIPTFIRECLEHNIAPLDGLTLTEALHQRGINIRYLGVIATIVSTAPPLSYLYRLLVSEMIIRAAKHSFKIYMQGVGMVSLSVAISHFLNCFLGSLPNPQPPKADDEMSNGHGKKKRNKKKTGRLITALGQDSIAWANLSPTEMWTNLKAEVKEYFHFTLECDSIDTATETYNLQKVTLLRELCTKCGVQILLKDYDFDTKHKAIFTENDIINVFPVVKHINPIASDAYNFFQSGQAKIQQGHLKEGFELINEALNLFNNVYGPMHPEIASCMRNLARLNYLMGEHGEALEMQQKAVMMSERCNGVDHPNTISEYMHLALYCFANGQVTSALKLMYRSRYLTLLVCGEDHPEMAHFDSNIGLVLHGVGESDLALKFLERARKTTLKYHGTKSLKTALSNHLVGRVYSSRGDFRTALRHEKEAYTIYKEQFGEHHEKTKESSEFLRQLTQQAVNFQKTMNEIRKGNSRAAMRPIPFSVPSIAGVLDTLNMINGVFFIPVSIKSKQGAKTTTTTTEPLESIKAEVETPPEGKVESPSPSSGTASPIPEQDDTTEKMEVLR